MIRVYNTLSKSKEMFQPVTPGRVGIYLCGPTVYKPSHIGHMVGPVVFDTIKRYLVHNGYTVRFVINITDVDDKLIAEARVRGLPMDEVAAEMTTDYMRNLALMGVDGVDDFPRATENIDNIIVFVEDLVARGFAYESQGDVYFDVQKFPRYGKLSHRSREQMLGEGGSTAELKKSSCDFALWKSAKEGEPYWDSPWGPGRPGWHIECSVMSREILGETFDIHGGGLDLVFPHHENEVAQSEARHGKCMAKYWLHNGLMQSSDETGKLGGRKTRDGSHAHDADGPAAVEGDWESQEAGKISKSKGAGAFRELLERFDPEVIRFFLLSTHYRRPIDYGEDRLRQSAVALDAFHRFFKRYFRMTRNDFYAIAPPRTREEGRFDPGNDPFLSKIQTLRTKFFEMMDDDFNTGGAIGVLFDFLRILNKYVDETHPDPAKEPDESVLRTLIHGTTVLRELSSVLGIFRNPPREKEGGRDDEVLAGLVRLAVALRAKARNDKDFAGADYIRNTLDSPGIVLEDRPGGTEWSWKS